MDERSDETYVNSNTRADRSPVSLRSTNRITQVFLFIIDSFYMIGTS